MIAGTASIFRRCLSGLFYVLYATSLIGKVYKDVCPQSRPDCVKLTEEPQTAHVPYALPTTDRYLVLVRSKKQITELDMIPEHHVSFHAAMADVSFD